MDVGLEGLDGLGALTRVARALGRDASRDWRREIRAAGAPMVKDAKARFRRLDGVLTRSTARSVSLAINQRGVDMKMGGARYPAAFAREFGTNRGKTRLHTRTQVYGKPVTPYRLEAHINYAARGMFGTWTGNDRRAGRAFMPAYREGRADALRRLHKLRNDYVNRLMQATN